MQEFFIIGIPKPQARARTFIRPGARFATTWSPKTDWFSVCYATALANRPKTPFTGPLMVKLRFHLPRPKSVPKTKIYPDVRPDLDNYEKAVLDAFTQAVIWEDDGQICDLQSQKIYVSENQQSGCYVWITDLNGN